MHIKEDLLPGPIGRGQTGIISDVSKGIVTAVDEESIAHDLRSVGGRVDRGYGVESGCLALAQPMIPALHVCHEEIDVAIPVDIREIDAHGAEGDVPESGPLNRSKIAVSVVQPKPIRGPVVVADINV